MKKILSVLLIIILLLFCSQFIRSQTVPFRFRIITWNVGNSLPDCQTFEHLAFSSVSNGFVADLIVFGFQEASKKLVGSTSFHATLTNCLQNKEYTEIIADYVGSNLIKPIWLYIYVLNEIIQSQRVNVLKFKNELTLKVHPDKFLVSIIGYKGVIASRLQIDETINVVFANMHLPAGVGKAEQRCKLLSKFLQTYQADNVNDDYMFLFGDQNWRTRDTLSMDTILEAIKNEEYQTILDNDELIEMRQNDNTGTTKTCLNAFHEAPITFPPTYKYIVNTDNYQTQKDNEDRRPSYTDRILISDLSSDLKIIQYSVMKDIKLSDHRPVFADFMLYHRPTQNIQSPHKTKTNRTRPTKTNALKIPRKMSAQKTLKKKPSLSIITIIIIALIGICCLVVIYYFIIKRRTTITGIPGASLIDHASEPSDSETTFTNY